MNLNTYEDVLLKKTNEERKSEQEPSPAKEKYCSPPVFASIFVILLLLSCGIQEPHEDEHSP